MKAHVYGKEDILNKLDSNTSGLNKADVEERRIKSGWNELPDVGRRTWLQIFIKQFKSLLVAILGVAAVVSAVTGHLVDMYVIIAVIFINAIIGFVQELRAENAVASLKSMLIPQAKIKRDGQTTVLEARELVPGDILILEEGDSVPADARLIEAKNLRAIEAPLTGESVPVNKQAEKSLPENTPLADRTNMVFKGTFISGGFAIAVVTHTALNTALGEIARTLGKIKSQKTNFQKKVDVLAKQMAVVSIVSASLLFFVAYFFRNMEMDEILMISIAALVSALPEGLPAVLAIVLAIGAGRMAKKNAIIREFTATETLGAVTTIITDKTGTLTQNTLTVRRVFVFGEKEWQISGEGWVPIGNFTHDKRIVEAADFSSLTKLLKIAAWSNNSEIQHQKDINSYKLIGDPTEGALLVLARKAGFVTKQNVSIKKIDDFPFNSNIKMRASLVDDEGAIETWIIGAPEKVLEKSTYILTEHGVEPLTSEKTELIREKIESWSDEAMRVIALAYRIEMPDKNNIDENELNEIVFVGIAGMIDPPRPDVKMAIASCKSAGIRVLMATGDHINTAVAIAKATGIIDENEPEKNIALTEKQLETLNDEEFEQAILKTNVFARLTPNMKLKIATRLQQNGELIAMTGDGVNDAPALKKADVGIAMGIMGTDVARDSAKVVLADDNFSTIVHAIEEGRIVFTNARQTSFFLITTNFAEIITLLTAILVGLPIPLTATQILWLNLVTDGVGDLSLATEKGHGDILQQKPVNPKEPILNKEIFPFLILNAILMTILALGAFVYFLPFGENKARSAAFIVMAMSQLFNVFNMRALRRSVFSIGIFSNKYINLALTASLIIQIVIIEIPFFERLFSFDYIAPIEFMLLITISSSVLWFGEIYKHFRYRHLKLNVIK